MYLIIAIAGILLMLYKQVIDRFTYYTLEFFESIVDPSSASMQQLVGNHFFSND